MVATRLDELLEETGSAVVLVGSGASAVAPSAVPTWYRLNASAFDAIRRIALSQLLSNSDSRMAVETLAAEAVPIATFSQVLSNVFAGRGWLGLLTVLDGEQTNVVHQALAAAVRDGRCAAIVTTNFDTLIERAADELGFAIPLVSRHHLTASGADTSQPALYKIHGTVTDPNSMVDLLLDKGVGLGPGTRGVLGELCRSRHLIVLGFSGEDFVLDSDYFGLVEGAALPAKITWILRPGSTLTAGARAFLDLHVALGVPTSVGTHSLEDLVGATTPIPTSTPDPRQRRIDEHVDNWVAEHLTFPPTAALAMAVFLRLQGDHRSAAEVRQVVRESLTSLDKTLDDEGDQATRLARLHLVASTAAWALLGKEEHMGDTALADLRQAERAMDRFDRWLSAIGRQLSGDAAVEQRLLRAAIRQNAAVVWLLAGNPDPAERFLADAEAILAEVPGREMLRRLGGIYHQRGLLSLIRNQLVPALTAFELSIRFSRTAGDISQHHIAQMMLAVCLRAFGDWEVAEMVYRDGLALGRATTDANWRHEIEHLVRERGSLLDAEMLANFVDVIHPSPPWDELALARAAGDAPRILGALVANAERDLAVNGGARIGSTLLSLELYAGVDSPTSVFTTTVRSLCSTDLSTVPEHNRFVLRVIEIGLDALAGDRDVPANVVDELQAMGRPSAYQAALLAPRVFGLGLHTLAKSAAQAGFEAYGVADYERAERLFHLGARGFGMYVNSVDAIRAELYRFDALFALGRLADAAQSLADLHEAASLRLPVPYLARYVMMVTQVALEGDPYDWPDAAHTVSAIIADIIRRSPEHTRRAQLVGALSLARLSQVALAEQFLAAVDPGGLTPDDETLLIAAREAIHEQGATDDAPGE